MSGVGIVLATGACGSGLWAARKWREASLVPIDPGWGTPGVAEIYTVPGLGIEAYRHIQPVDPARSASELGTAISTAASESGRLNKVAAMWTAISVGLSGISVLADATSNYFLTH